MLKKDDWRLLRAIVVGVSFVVLLLTWGVSLQRLAANKEQVIDLARKQQSNLAVIVAENLKQLLDSTWVIAATSEQWWKGSQADVENRLSVLSETNPAFLRVALYDIQGERVYSSSPVSDEPALTLAIKEALQDATSEQQVVLPDIRSLPEEIWYKPLLFPITRVGGGQLGFLMVTLDLGYLLKVYQDIDFGDSGVIHILSEDAQQVLEWRPEGLVLNIQKHYFKMFADQATEKKVNTVFVDLFHEGNLYQSSIKAVESFPFLVVVSRSVDDILQPYKKSKFHALFTLTVLTIIILTGLYFVVRSIAQHGRLFSALLASNEKNHSLITRLEDEKGRAYMLAARDHLTGLPNRRSLKELVVQYLERNRQQHGYSALMYLDLDRFKLVNDTLGHHIGDILLQTVAKRLQTSLRTSDIVARLGGDEFAVFVTGVMSIEAISRICDKIIHEVGQPVLTQDGVEIYTSPSIGIALFPRDGEDFDTLCKNADVAMYESKRKGRGTYTYYKAALAPACELRFKLEQHLPMAIEKEELVLYYQPKVRLSDFKIVGFEALVRWQHPELGLVSPADFIPLAEELELIAELGEWGLRSCCALLAQWQAEGVECVPLAINMSSVQLQDKTLPARIETILKEYAVPANLIEIEITETVFLDSIETAAQVLQKLETLGVRIALDDFGSGFSSFSYVRALPIHTIKIDQQFIGDIRNSTQDAVLVASIISLANSLNMEVVAEGVETLEQLIYLKTAGCKQAQGYYFSRPVPAQDARVLLSRGAFTPATEMK